MIVRATRCVRGFLAFSASHYSVEPRQAQSSHSRAGAEGGLGAPSLDHSTFHRAWGVSCRVVGPLPDKLNLNGHGRSSISNGALDAHHDADHRSRLCPARPSKCAPGGPSQSSAAKQSPGRATHRPAVPKSAPPQAPQAQSPQPQGSQYSSNEIVDAGHRFFGTISRGLAQIVEKAGSQFGLPNGYVLGQEGGGAVVAGLRYGEGILYTKNAGDLRVFWQGPSLGYDFGVEGARTMMLIYNLPATDAIYQRFCSIDGSAYFVGGLGMTALTMNNIVVVPIRTGVGIRLGANIGYLKFTPTAIWNPF